MFGLGGDDLREMKSCLKSIDSNMKELVKQLGLIKQDMQTARSESVAVSTHAWDMLQSIKGIERVISQLEVTKEVDND